MAMIPTTGPVTFQQLYLEYGGGSPVSLGNYYKSLNNTGNVDHYYTTPAYWQTIPPPGYPTGSTSYCRVHFWGVNHPTLPDFHIYNFYWGNSTTPIYTINIGTNPNQNTVYIENSSTIYQAYPLTTGNTVNASPFLSVGPTAGTGFFVNYTTYANYLSIAKRILIPASTQYYNTTVPHNTNDPISLSQFRGQRNP